MGNSWLPGRLFNRSCAQLIAIIMVNTCCRRTSRKRTQQARSCLRKVKHVRPWTCRGLYPSRCVCMFVNVCISVHVCTIVCANYRP